MRTLWWTSIRRKGPSKAHATGEHAAQQRKPHVTALVHGVSTPRDGIRGRLGGANVQLARSKKLLGGMARRAAANKVLMVVIILILISMIGLIIYLQWFAGSGSTSPSPPPSPPGSPPTHQGRLRMSR